MKHLRFPAVAILLGIGIFFACKRDVLNKQGEEKTDAIAEQTAGTNAKKAALSTPTLACAGATAASINLQVCAGASGAPAGFSVQWMLKADYDQFGWPANSDDPANPTSFCKSSFSGVPACSNYNLAASTCITVNIGENLFDACGASATCLNQLQCGKEYVFRSFAHNDPRSGIGKSDFSAITTCSTLPCGGGGCTYSQGYWKTHGPQGCNPASSGNTWPVTNLTLGNVNYTDLQLCSILNTPAAGNGLISLAHQLIAAKLNIANGADGSAIAQAVASADALIGNWVIPPVGSGSLSPASTSALITALTSYNEGATGPGHCN
jgi:hypothetical protein